MQDVTWELAGATAGTLVLLALERGSMRLVAADGPQTAQRLVASWTPGERTRAAAALWADLLLLVPLILLLGWQLAREADADLRTVPGLALLAVGAAADVVEDGCALACIATSGRGPVGPMRAAHRLKWSSAAGLAVLLVLALLAG